MDNPATNGQEQRGYATLEAFEANDQVAMRQYDCDWQGRYSPRTGTNIGLLAARAETGVQWQGYRLGALYRAEALVQANRATSIWCSNTKPAAATMWAGLTCSTIRSGASRRVVRG